MTEQSTQVFPKENRISTHSQQVNTHYILLDDDIDVPSAYRDELHLINTANESETIVLDICTGGGVLDTAMLFNRALNTTQAHTVAIIGPTCASAGSVIALSCREWVVDDNSSLMCHTSSYGIQAKDTDIYEHANFSRKQLLKLYNNVYKGFLSEEEISDVIKGTPFYFDSDELSERLDRLMDYRMKIEQEEYPVGEDGSEQHKSLDQMIEEAVSSFYKKLKKDFEITPKVKVKATKAAKSPSPATA